MKLMILSSRVPWPLDKGDKLRMYHQIKALSSHHEIHLIALSETNDNAAAEKELLQYCKQVHFFHLSKLQIAKGVVLAFLKGSPLQVGYFYNASIARKVRKLVEEIQPDHIYGQLVRVVEYLKKVDVPKTLDLQDAFSAGLERRVEKAKGLFKSLLRLEAKRMSAYERNDLQEFDNLCIITQADKDLLDSSIRKRVEILPNGVDFDFFFPKQTPQIYDVVFTGNMNYPPNVMAAKFLVKEIMPKVWKEIPQVKVFLAGASPHPSVKALASENVVVSGWLDDIRDAYSSAKIFVAPMQIGTGLQNKLLEAMAMTMPCVTSDLANAALQAKDGEEILIADRKDSLAFARHILRLLQDQQCSSKIAQSGNKFVKANFDWNASVEILNRLWRN